MIIEVKKPITEDKAREILTLLSRANSKKTLRKHFGKLKRDLDGLKYQEEVRNEWP